MTFQKGQSGNPAGRVPGSRNKGTMLMDNLLEGDREAIVRKAGELAKDGNIVAIRLCFSHFGSTKRGEPVTCDLPAMNTSADGLTAKKTILAEVAAGELTPGEGKDLATMTGRSCRRTHSWILRKESRQWKAAVERWHAEESLRSPARHFSANGQGTPEGRESAS